jgi:hypothetical protein
LRNERVMLKDKNGRHRERGQQFLHENGPRRDSRTILLHENGLHKGRRAAAILCENELHTEMGTTIAVHESEPHR